MGRITRPSHSNLRRPTQGKVGRGCRREDLEEVTGWEGAGKERRVVLACYIGLAVRRQDYCSYAIQPQTDDSLGQRLLPVLGRLVLSLEIPTLPNSPGVNLCTLAVGEPTVLISKEWVCQELKIQEYSPIKEPVAVHCLPLAIEPFLAEDHHSSCGPFSYML